jgi:hypothetical protein
LSYLAPPPMPAAVIVTKDVGGFVTDYQNQTALYRASQREVRLHECRSACTLALSLPNVCVYPDSILKFHLAYDPRNHQPNADVSQQMFATYPAAVQARLGTLTRDYKVLRGSELISLGIRDCNAPKTSEPKPSEPQIMVASVAARKQPVAAPPQTSQEIPVFASLMGKMLSVFGTSETASALPGRATVAPPRAAKPTPGLVLVAEIPLPPPRPADLAQPAGVAAEAPLQAPGEDAAKAAVGAVGGVAAEAASGAALVETAEAAPLPPRRPGNAALSAMRRLARIALPKLITGAQPILPPDFSAYADLDR